MKSFIQVHGYGVHYTDRTANHSVFCLFLPTPLTVRISTKEELGAPHHQAVPIKESI